MMMKAMKGHPSRICFSFVSSPSPFAFSSDFHSSRTVSSESIRVHPSPSESIVHQLPSSKSSFDPVSVDDAALDSMTRRYIQPVWPTWQVCAANKQQLTFIDILCKLHKICPRKVFVKDLICDMFQRKTMLKVECRSQAWSPSSPACSELSSNAKSKTIKLVIYI